MKKYTLKFCGLAIALGMASSSMATPVTGMQTITGTLSSPTCTISIPSDVNLSTLTTKQIDAKAYTGVFENAQIGTISIKNCGMVTASGRSPQGSDPLGPGNARFKYENATTSNFNKEPLMYQVIRTPGDGRVESNNGIRPDRDVTLKDGDSLKIILSKAPGNGSTESSASGKIENVYIGGYSSLFTFNFKYI